MQSAEATVARNSLFSVAGQIALKLLSFAFVILVVRQLGETDYGRYSAALAFVGIFSVFADMGVASYAVREIARSRDRAPSLLVNMAVIRVGLAVLVIACTVGGAWLVGYDRSMIGL
ncbi:MAG TPA: oligosaccharide flippase family protein, partial [Thermomicrobiales bacterium]|nr:oligosaccharide flippase family protein [Thermomicrobiales bacterium]